MYKSLAILTFAFFVSVNCYGHSGRTDKNGGHNCSAASIQKGLCTGYHYHNGRAYLDMNEELLEVASLNSEDHFHNIDADDHALSDDHLHSHETDKDLEGVGKATDKKSI